MKKYMRVAGLSVPDVSVTVFQVCFFSTVSLKRLSSVFNSMSRHPLSQLIPSYFAGPEYILWRRPKSSNFEILF